MKHRAEREADEAVRIGPVGWVVLLASFSAGIVGSMVQPWAWFAGWLP